MFIVEIPTYNQLLPDTWDQIAEFETREEAVDFVAKKFLGVDGKIDLISEISDGSLIGEYFSRLV